MKKSILILFCLLNMVLSSLWAMPPKTVIIKSDTAEFDLQIKYPQDFSSKTIDKAVLEFIEATRKANTNHPKNNKVPNGAPGINSLYVDYNIEFENKTALSLLFSISTFAQGAAHPNNSVSTLNFINGEKVSLGQLFQDKSDYLTMLAEFSLAALNKKDIDDKDWIKKGSEGTADNYKNWYFSNNGLVIVFDTYQVAAYVYGPQTVEIPKSKLINILRPEVVRAVWGSQ